MELIAKIVYGLLISGFAVGVWVTSIQFTQSAHGAEISNLKLENKERRERDEKYLETVIRIDERLGNIERKRK